MRAARKSAGGRLPWWGGFAAPPARVRVRAPGESVPRAAGHPARRTLSPALIVVGLGLLVPLVGHGAPSAPVLAALPPVVSPTRLVGGRCSGVVLGYPGGTLEYVATLSPERGAAQTTRFRVQVTLKNGRPEPVTVPYLTVLLCVGRTVVRTFDIPERTDVWLQSRVPFAVRPTLVEISRNVVPSGLVVAFRLPGPDIDPGPLLPRVERALAAGKVDEALKLADEALKAARRPVDVPAQAMACRARAMAYEASGRLSDAETAWREAAQAYRAVGKGAEYVETWGRAQLLAGSPADAAGLLALAGGSADGPPFADALHVLGEVALSMGYWDSAEKYHHRAQEIRAASVPGTLAHARSLDALGVVTWYRGDVVLAEDYLRRALDIERNVAPGGLEEALTLETLGNVAFTRGDAASLAAAQGFLAGALAIHEKREIAAGSREEERRGLRLHKARVWHGLGSVAAQSGKPDEALGYYQRALDVEQAEAPSSLQVAATYNELGVLARERGEHSEAEEYHKQAIGIERRLASGSLELAQSLHNLGLVCRERENWQEAAGHAREAWSIAARQGERVSGDQAQQAFGQRIARYAGALIAYQVALGQPEQALDTLEQARARALQGQLAEKELWPAVGGALWSGYKAAMYALDRALQSASAAFSAQGSAERNLRELRGVSAPPEAIRAAEAAVLAAGERLVVAQRLLNQARADAEAREAELRRSNEKAGVTPKPARPVLAAMPAGTLFVAFAVNGRDVSLLAARQDGSVQGWRLPITEAELVTRVQSFRHLVTDHESTEAEVVAAGRSLFATLFPGPAGEAVAMAGRLLIAPDGPLWQLPFAALTLNATGPPVFVGGVKPLTYAPSLTLFAQMRAEKPRLAAGASRRVLVVGLSGPSAPLPPPVPQPRIVAQGVVRGAWRMAGETLPPLPNAVEEARRIAALYQVAPVLGAEATEERVRAQMEEADVVHFATHGRVHPRLAMASAVLLAPSRAALAPGLDDEWLQAREIWRMRLRAEVVVLSACSTGLGESVPGEGVIGLPRALHYAGARSVVASQWCVEDRSTAALMTALHANLVDGAAKDDALLGAMAAVRGRPETAHPFYWAGFYLTGDPGNPAMARRPAAPPATRPTTKPAAKPTQPVKSGTPAAKPPQSSKPGAPAPKRLPAGSGGRKR